MNFFLKEIHTFPNSSFLILLFVMCLPDDEHMARVQLQYNSQFFPPPYFYLSSTFLTAPMAVTSRCHWRSQRGEGSVASGCSVCFHTIGFLAAIPFFSWTSHTWWKCGKRSVNVAHHGQSVPSINNKKNPHSSCQIRFFKTCFLI